MKLGIDVGGVVDGGVVVPFKAICVVNGQPFAGRVTVSWNALRVVPEYDALARLVGRRTRRRTTCEGLALSVRRALRKEFPHGVSVRVDVTSEGHLPAWAVAR